ncbi:MAG: carboxypeptidase-like regulatory domain-containing protein [Planctomycetota bacterium]|nr:carboxypeptidase-like regulatory domain-containing protein [Planctomycetota bacterium]
MRAFIALLVILALAAGGYFMSQSGSNQDDPSGLDPTGQQNVSTENTPEPGDTALAGIDTPTERTTSTPDVVEEGSTTITTKGEGQPGEILGRVINSEGRAISNAKVTLTRFGGAAMFFSGPGDVDRTTDRTVETNKDGEFRFKDVESFDMYTLIAVHPEYAHVERSPLDATSGAVIEQELVMGSGSRVFGTIQDTQGNVVGGATVVLTPTALGAGVLEGSPTKHETTSAADGTYEFPHCAKDTHVLTVSAEGYGQVTIPNLNISGMADVERNVEMQAAQFLGGMVVDTEGNPIKGAKVEAFSMTNRASRTQTQAKTDAEGNYLFEDVPGGNYTLRATAKGYKTATKPRINAGEMDVTIQLASLPTVSGQVFDDKGEPATNFTVNLRQPMRGSELTMFVSKTRTKVKSADGTFKITVPMAGEYLVEAQAGSFAPSLSNSFTITDGQNLSGIDVTLKGGGIIRGRVVDPNGKPIAGATIKTDNNDWTGSGFDISLGEMFPGISTKKSAKSNASGEFILRGLHPTKYLVQISHSGFANTAMRNVIVTEGVETNLKDVRMETGSTVSGVVRGPNGAPLSAATVHLQMETATEFPLSYRVRTNKDGAYEVKAVRSGTYWISAQRPSSGGNNPFAGSADLQTTRRRISISGDGAYQGQDFEIQD